MTMRELDYYDTYLVKDYAHYGDKIWLFLAMAQQTNCTGGDFVGGLIPSYGTQKKLFNGISSHKDEFDYISHSGPATPDKEAFFGCLTHLLVLRN